MGCTFLIQYMTIFERSSIAIRMFRSDRSAISKNICLTPNKAHLILFNIWGTIALHLELKILRKAPYSLLFRVVGGEQNSLSPSSLGFYTSSPMFFLGLAIRVHGSGSCQPDWPDYINGSDTNPTRLLSRLKFVTRTRPDCKPSYPTRTRLTHLFHLKKKMKMKLKLRQKKPLLYHPLRSPKKTQIYNLTVIYNSPKKKTQIYNFFFIYR
jgi:hypothetical protein